jgi:hypothetical protein
MKNIVILFLLLPFFTPAQDCNLRDEKDRLNQDPRLTTGFKAMATGSNKFLLSVSADKREVDFFFALDNSSDCFNDLSRATVIFEGGKQRATFQNGGTTNCRGYFHFIFKNQENLPANLKNLTLKKAISIQFAGPNNSKKTVTLRPEDGDMIMKMANCVVNELADLRVDTWKPKQ